MPLYEYRCKKCSNIFETLRGYHENDADIVCPKCGDKSVERLISVFRSLKGDSSTSNVSSCGPGKFT